MALRQCTVRRRRLWNFKIQCFVQHRYKYLDKADEAMLVIILLPTVLRANNMQGPRLCNRIILASKCHAIRDAQISEKDLIKKELDGEEKRYWILADLD